MTTCYRLLMGALPNLEYTALSLIERLDQTRWPPGWDEPRGSSNLVRSHAEGWMDWLRHEPTTVLGDHQKVAVEGGCVQVVRFRGSGQFPILMLHGWPTSFLAFHRVILPLQGVASEVILAVLPGFGGTPAPANSMSGSSIVSALAEMMTVLGHVRFFVHGQDWGSDIGRRMAAASPDRVIGVHVSAGLQGFLADSAECGRAWDRLRDFAVEGSAYLALQSHRPDSLAVALNDSPVGLLAWHLDKFQLWQQSLGSDFGLGDDFIYANATHYWATEAIRSSMQIYVDNRGAPVGSASPVPTGVSVFGAGDFASRRVSARENNLVAWYEHSNGGHVASLDAETEFVADLSTFVNLVEVGA